MAWCAVTSSSILPDDGPSEVAAYAIWTRNATPPPLPPREVTFGEAVVSVSRTPQVGQPLTASLSGSRCPVSRWPGSGVTSPVAPISLGLMVRGTRRPLTRPVTRCGSPRRVRRRATRLARITRTPPRSRRCLRSGCLGVSGVARLGQKLSCVDGCGAWCGCHRGVAVAAIGDRQGDRGRQRHRHCRCDGAGVHTGSGAGAVSAESRRDQVSARVTPHVLTTSTRPGCDGECIVAATAVMKGKLKVGRTVRASIDRSHLPSEGHRHPSLVDRWAPGPSSRHEQGAGAPEASSG